MSEDDSKEKECNDKKCFHESVEGEGWGSVYNQECSCWVINRGCYRRPKLPGAP